MSHLINRRRFLSKTAQVAALTGLGNYSFLSTRQDARANIANSSEDKMQFSSDIEPLVRCIEETSREKLLGQMSERVKNGLRYPDLLAASFLAGVRDIEPRPVGFKFHAVMVMYAIHVASLATDDNDRWLPTFWALDNFKDAQARNKEEGGWYLKQVDELQLPSGVAARESFIEAMDNWQDDKADRAITGLVREAGSQEICELFWRYAARDFRNIGHKAIYTANGLRTLQIIGWQHAEPVARSLAYAMLDKSTDHAEDLNDKPVAAWHENLERATKIRDGWIKGRMSSESTGELLSILRKGSISESCDSVVDFLNKEIDPASLWDALFLQAGELMMRKPGIITVHCVTSMNALHYGFQTSGIDRTRRLLLLQAAAFLGMFHEMLGMTGSQSTGSDKRIDTFEPALIAATEKEASERIFADVKTNPTQSCRMALAYLNQSGRAETFMDTARHLICAKGDESHDYKFSTAVFEDYYHISPAWRDRYLAASVFHLCASTDPDTDVLKQVRHAVK